MPWNWLFWIVEPATCSVQIPTSASLIWLFVITVPVIGANGGGPGNGQPAATRMSVVAGAGVRKSKSPSRLLLLRWLLVMTLLLKLPGKWS